MISPRCCNGSSSPIRRMTDENPRHPPEEPGLSGRRTGHRFHRGTPGQRRAVRHHRAHRCRQEHHSRRPVPGAVRQHAAARQRFAAEQGARGRCRDRRWRRAQPAAPRLRQRLRRGRFRRRRRSPLPRTLGGQARPREDRRPPAGQQPEPYGSRQRHAPGQRQETRIQGTARSPPWADPGPVHPRRAAGAERIFRLPQGRRQRARHSPGKAHRYRPLQPPRPGRLRGRQGGEGRPRPSGAAGRRPAATGAGAA